MKYNERTGEFERTPIELVGYIIGYVSPWIFCAAVMALMATAIYRTAAFVWRLIGL